MQDFHEWLESQDPETLEEIFGQLKDRLFGRKARPFNDEERRKLAAIQQQKQVKRQTPDHRRRPQQSVVSQKSSDEINWIG